MITRTDTNTLPAKYGEIHTMEAPPRAPAPDDNPSDTTGQPPKTPPDSLAESILTRGSRAKVLWATRPDPPAVALVDTGASVTLMTSTLADQVTPGWEFSATPANVVVTPVLGQVPVLAVVHAQSVFIVPPKMPHTRMKVAIQDVHIVAPEYLAGPQVDLLIGRDALEVNRLVLGPDQCPLDIARAPLRGKAPSLPVAPSDDPDVQDARKRDAAATAMMATFDKAAAFKAHPELKSRRDLVRLHIPADTDTIRATYSTFHKMSDDKRTECLHKLKAMMEADIIERSPSHIRNRLPVVVVTKPNGGIRLTLDCRRLNNACKDDTAPLLHVHEIIHRHTGRAYLSTIDFANAFWHLPLRQEDRHWTAFDSPLGLFVYKVMPQGLKCAPSVWQNFMVRIFGDLIMEKKMDVYMDDIIISSDTEDEHTATLHRVLQVITTYGLHVDRTKSQFYSTALKFLGVHISRVGSAIHDARLDALLGIPRPQTKKELRSWLGAVNWVSAHVPHCAVLASDLHRATSLDAAAGPARGKVAWSPDLITRYGQLCSMLQKAQILARPDLTQPFLIYTDAAPSLGFGAVLVQEYADGPRVVGLFSHACTLTQKQYSAVDLELYGLKAAVMRFQVLTGLSTRITVFTDNEPTVKIFNDRCPQGDMSADRLRWIMAIQNRGLVVKHIPGADNKVADALSRLPRLKTLRQVTTPVDTGEAQAPTAAPHHHVPELMALEVDGFRYDSRRTTRSMTRAGTGHLGSPQPPTEVAPTPVPRSRPTRARPRPPDLLTTATEIIAPSGFDPEMAGAATDPIVQTYRIQASATLADDIREGQTRYPELRRAAAARPDAVVDEHDTVFIADRDGHHRVWVPPCPSLRTRLLELIHVEGTQHRGRQGTLDFLRDRVYWGPGLDKAVIAYVNGCVRCGQQKHDHRGPSALTPVVRHPTHPYAHISMDILQVPQQTRSEFNHVLVTVCYFSRHATYTPLHITARGVDIVKALQENVFALFGFPRAITADRDVRWTGHVFRDWAAAHNIELQLTTSHNRNRNGLVERHNKVIGTGIRTMLDAYPDVPWHTHLPMLQVAWNSTVCRPTGLAPNDLLFTYRPITPVDASLPEPPGPRTSVARIVLGHFRTAMRHIKTTQEQMMKHRARRRLRKPFEVHQPVYVCNPDRPAGSKAESPNIGPFAIKSKVRDNVFSVEITQTGTGRRRIEEFHAEQMQPYLGPWPLPDRSPPPNPPRPPRRPPDPAPPRPTRRSEPSLFHRGVVRPMRRVHFEDSDLSESAARLEADPPHIIVPPCVFSQG